MTTHFIRDRIALSRVAAIVGLDTRFDIAARRAFAPGQFLGAIGIALPTVADDMPTSPAQAGAHRPMTATQPAPPPATTPATTSGRRLA